MRPAVVALATVALTSILIACQRPTAANEAQTSIQSTVRIVTDQEPGEPLSSRAQSILLTGKKYYRESRSTFIRPMRLVAIQPAAAIIQHPNSWVMRTNAQGRYEFRTIKPGSYPNSRNPAHIHAYVSGPGYPEYWIDEYLFADDPFIKDEDKAKSKTRVLFHRFSA